MIRHLRGHFGSALVVNSYLILIMRFLGSATGFIFWALAARALTEENVGLASSAIAASALLAGLAQLGLGYGLVRFLGQSANPAGLINLTCAVVGGVGAILGIGFLLGLDFWSPALTPLIASTEAIASFIILIVTTSMFQLINWAFLAKRKTTLSLINNTLQSILNIILFVLLAYRLPNYLSAVHAYTLSTVISVAVSVLILLPMAGHTQRAFIWPRTIRSRFARYSLSNFVTDQLQKIPDTLMILVVVNVLGPQVAGYFFVVWTMNAGLRALAGSTATSLLVEGAHKPELAAHYAIKSLKHGMFLATCMAAGVTVLSRFILMFYGQDYVEQSTVLLILLSIALIPNVVVTVVTSLLRIRGNVWMLITVTAVDLVIGLIGVYVGMIPLGLVGVGIGWLVSRIVMLGVSVLIWKWDASRQTGEASAASI